MNVQRAVNELQFRHWIQLCKMLAVIGLYTVFLLNTSTLQIKCSNDKYTRDLILKTPEKLI